MKIRVYLWPLICVSFITAHAQSITIDINAANPQRTRVLNTRGLEAAPSQVLWKTEKLFEYRSSEWMPGIAGPLSMSIYMPTFQNFTIPILAGDLLYFSFLASDGYLFAIDKATGRKVMVLKLDNIRISKPAARDNIVFFGSARGEVHAYDVSKRADKWTFLDKDHSFAGSYPTLDRDLLYFYAYDRGLYAFDVETGVVKWLFKADKPVHAPPVAGDRVIVLTATGRLIALDRASGAVRWHVSVGRDANAPAVLGDQIFLVYDNGELRRYSAVDGSLQWKSKGVPRSGTPLALHNGLLYYGGRDTDVLAIDATSGAEKLRFKTKKPCNAPTIAGEMLYVRCHDNTMYALSTATLTQVWQIQNGKVFPPAALFADGVMYSLGEDGIMYALK